ncbi:MAG: LytR/AlgR family response regulator transcription factor [Chitinophagales bacterium]
MKETIKCLIVDDEPLAINIIKRYVSQLASLELVGTCDSAVEAFEVLKNESVDLIFLDINMPLMTGIEFVRALQQPPSIIFTTAHRNYAVESYELNVVDYLLKPFSFTRFFQAVDKYLDQQKNNPIPSLQSTASPIANVDAFLYVNSNKKYIKVVFDKVLFIESVKDYIRIHLTNKTIVTKEKISTFQQKLPSQFLRTHRSFIVNTQQITAFSSLQIEVGEETLPIGNSYKREVLEVMKGS